MMSRESLLVKARHYSYKPEILEKVYRLLFTLKQISEIPYLNTRLVLKGGTALNLFHFEPVPRLSVDIDLNYIGQLDRTMMLEEKPLINDAIEKILIQNQLERYRSPNYHAGGKVVWRYPSVLGQKGNLEIDLNYMYRQPLWSPETLSPKLEIDQSFQFNVLDLHELAAGKLSALMTRTASRDLYDAHYLLTRCRLDSQKLRLAFVVYMSMTDLEHSLFSIGRIQHNERDIHHRLLPVLRQVHLPRSPSAIKAWAEKLTQELKEALNQLLPLEPNEIEFISQIQKFGKINASLITDDLRLQQIVNQHPALQWSVKRNQTK